MRIAKATGRARRKGINIRIMMGWMVVMMSMMTVMSIILIMMMIRRMIAMLEVRIIIILFFDESQFLFTGLFAAMLINNFDQDAHHLIQLLLFCSS